MSYIDLPTGDDLPELQILDDGTEACLRIKKAEVANSKKGLPQLVLVLEDSTNPLVDDIFQYVALPQQSQRESDIKAFTKSVKNLKDFLACFDISSDLGFDTENLVGQTGWCIVGTEEYEGTLKNKVKSYIIKR